MAKRRNLRGGGAELAGRPAGQVHGASLPSACCVAGRLYKAPHPGSPNVTVREFYQRLRTNGKPAKVALTAVMRKFLPGDGRDKHRAGRSRQRRTVLLNRLLKNPNFNLVS